MNDNPFETEIRYRLVKVTSAKTKEGSDAYRAVTSHDPIDMMDLAKRGDPELAMYVSTTRPTLAINIAASVLEAMVAGVLQDGRTRRLGDLLEIRGDIRGRFDSPTEAFNPKKHRFVLNVKLLKGFKGPYRRYDSPKLAK